VGVGGCFNNTICHGVQGHAGGWAAASAHGAEAKKAPGGSTGFSSCQPCHGTSFNNGTAPTCMNSAACHGSGVNSPHARKPWFSRVAGQPTHTTTDAGNVGICAACHTGGANSTLGNTNAAAGPAGCFNNTLCHFHQIPFAPSATVPVTLHSGEAGKDLSICQGCHGQKGTTAFDGATLSDGTKTIACSSCHTSARAHPTDWQGSGTFSHRTAGNINVACIICHDVTQGRTAPLAASPSCFSATFTNGAVQTRTCHASGSGVVPHIVPYNNHNATARSNFNYCLGCHQTAANAAGSKPPGCQNCHLASPVATPAGCTSCHAKPPAGNVYPDFAALHASHASLNVAENTTLTAVCDQCHNGLGLGTLDHLNRARARTAAVQAGPVVFGALAATGSLTPTYTAAARTCDNTYCHGTTLAGFNLDPNVIRAPSWNTPFPAGTHCDKCHGYPPVTSSHAAIPGPTQCIGCHSHVNAAGTGFSDVTKHINGSVDATGAHAFPNPGSAHKTAVNGTGCRSTGCHPADAAGSAYPVAAGTPPNCRACHLNNSPSATPRCSDCHGSAGNDGSGALLAGRPSIGGTTFPNRPGEHNRSQHVGRACTACHPFTNTDSRHGWSNRTRSTAARVGGAGTSINSWNPATRSCSPTCHGTETW
jgi:predicted CxxxxCH...CXXCH cytochrome family protein